MSRMKYYVAARPQTNEYHAVHKEGCPFLPHDGKRIYLGRFSSVKEAVKESQSHFSKTKGCIFCSKEKQAVKWSQPLSDILKSDTLSQELCLPVSFHQSLICCMN
jgi:hypothetical protein